MARKVAAGPVDPVRSSAVELFFDLVFIFTLGRLSATLVEEPSLLADAQAGGHPAHRHRRRADAEGARRAAVDRHVVAILVGPLTFLVGRMIFEIWVFDRLTKHCLAAVVACLILSPVATRFPPLAVGLLGAATITVVAVFDLTHRARIAGGVNPVSGEDVALRRTR